MTESGDEEITESTSAAAAPPDAGATVASTDAHAAAPPRRRALRSWLRRGAVAAAILLVAIQLVPYGWAHPNPPVVADAPWPDAASAAIARTSCYSCHSNETDWPWYSYVAPASWLVRYDVERGRDELNFSDWDAGDADDAIEMIEAGEMPLDRYTVLHRDARLTAEEIDVLVRALRVMSDDDRDDGPRDDDRNDGRRDEEQRDDG